jgi:ribosomal protein S18 acetylase RimI-like enzyme
VEIREIGVDDVDSVMAAGSLFDYPPRQQWASRFLDAGGHHLLVAYVDGKPAGFISGVETTHPDKGTEMFLYELGVDEQYRRQGIGKALVAELRRVAIELGCAGMWVATEPDNIAAIATYRSGGADEIEESVVLSWTFGGG